MFHWLQSVLNKDELAELDTLLTDGDYEDGALTATGRAADVKNNQQLSDGGPRTRASEIIVAALQRHDKFQHAAIPLRIRTPLFSRYEAGMAYGQHMDNAIKDDGHGQDMRTDLSVTIFLSEPGDYQGGELIVSTSLNDQMFKLPRGDALLYPSTSLHRVGEVTTGIRQVAVTWVESRVRDPRQREILMDVERVRRRIAKLEPDSQEADLAQKVRLNLLRMWDRN